MGTILWCYMRNSAFKKDKDYHPSCGFDRPGNHLGVTIAADIIIGKSLREHWRLSGPQMGDSVTASSTSAFTRPCQRSPIDLCRYQVANC